MKVSVWVCVGVCVGVNVCVGVWPYFTVVLKHFRLDGVLENIWFEKWKLTGRDEQEEVIVSLQVEVGGGGVLHHKLAAVAVGVSGPQLGDADVDGVVARVSAHADAAPVSGVGREVAPSVHEQDLGGPQPGALQVDAEGRRGPAPQRTGQQDRLALTPLQELNTSSSWKEKNETVSTLDAL